jgi:hypothetical protein
MSNQKTSIYRRRDPAQLKENQQEAGQEFISGRRKWNP